MALAASIMLPVQMAGQRVTCSIWPGNLLVGRTDAGHVEDRRRQEDRRFDLAIDWAQRPDCTGTEPGSASSRPDPSPSLAAFGEISGPMNGSACVVLDAPIVGQVGQGTRDPPRRLRIRLQALQTRSAWRAQAAAARS